MMTGLENMRILYPLAGGGVAVVVPAPGVTLERLILRSVPAGSAYLVVPIDSIPSDRTFREAWTADFSEAEINDGVAA
jgi:hypothetical protein